MTDAGARPRSLDRPARRRLVRTGAAVGQIVLLPAASVAVSLVAVRSAGVDAWGDFVGAMILVQLAAQVADLGSRDALVRAFSREPGSASTRWRRAAASRALLLALGPLLFVAASNDPERVALSCFWLVALFVGRLHESVVVYRGAFGFALAVEVAAVGVTLAVVVAGGSSLSVTGIMAAFTAAAWIRAGAMVARFDVLRPGPGWQVGVSELRRSWPFFGLTFTGALQSRVDLYVVAALLPASALGTYQVLTAFVLLVQSLSGALLGPIVPALYRLARPGVLRGARRLALVGMLLATAGIATAWVAMTALYGLQIEPAALVAAWAAMVPVFAYLPLIHLAFREGDERIALMANLAGIAVAGAGAIVLAPSLGVMGAITAAAIAQSVMLWLHVIRTRRRAVPRTRPATDATDQRDERQEIVRALPDL